MTPGTTIMIYEDPITQLKPEGRAKLIRRLNYMGNQEYWLVRFMEGIERGRWITLKEEV